MSGCFLINVKVLVSLNLLSWILFFLLMNYQLLEAMYVINKKAKQLSKESKESYKNHDARESKEHSIKKEALYDLKAKLLYDNKSQADSIEIHEIKGDQYFYFIFGDFSFHSPVEKHETISEDNKNKLQLENFQTDSKNKTDKSLKDALELIKKETGYNANNFLKQEYVRRNKQEHYVGWLYLY